MKPRQTAPWNKSAPKRSRHTKLTDQSKAEAKAAAKRAGRPYPTLVDNMNAAKKQRASKSSRPVVKPKRFAKAHRVVSKEKPKKSSGKD